MWGMGGSGLEGANRASGRGGYGQGVGPPAFPWKRRGGSAKACRGGCYGTLVQDGHAALPLQLEIIT